tara:strand:- start:405 stop:1397 length:993 start_codon:yes stop_codon:yes gene_type:complete
MLDKELFFKLKWLVAKNELLKPDTTGSFSFQRPKSDSIIDIHTRVSGLHLGFSPPRTQSILTWISSVPVDILEIDRWIVKTQIENMPDIGIRWSEYEMTAMSDTVHCVYEFLQKHRERKPVIFKGEFWYFDKIIENKIARLDELTKDSVLIISCPYMERLQVKSNMNDILQRCCELGIPVLMDCIWLPLTSEKISLKNTDCIEMITHSVTKMLPLAGIKGGFAFYKKPLPIEMRHNEIHGKIGAYYLDKFIKQKGYWHVRDSHVQLQEKWCKIFGLEKHQVVIAGCLGNDNTLKDYGAKHINPLNLFSLVPYFNHDKSCTKFLADNGIET